MTSFLPCPFTLLSIPVFLTTQARFLLIVLVGTSLWTATDSAQPHEEGRNLQQAPFWGGRICGGDNGWEPVTLHAFLQVGGDMDGEAAYDESGDSVALSADGYRVAIGAPFNDGNGENSGHTRVLEWTGSMWEQLGDDIDGENAGDRSGRSVSLSSDGNRVAIGAPLNTETKLFAGHVRVFQWNGASWEQLGTDLDGEGHSDLSGGAVSLSADGSRLAIGAKDHDGTDGPSAGHVRVWEWTGTEWEQLGNDIEGDAASDLAGEALQLSSDGTRVAIGAVGNDDNGAFAGHVRVWEWTGVQWEQMGTDLDGQAAGDYAGHAVALSSDGSRVAVGAPGHDSDAGHVRVFGWNGTDWRQLGSDMDGTDDHDDGYRFAGLGVSLSDDGSRVAFLVQWLAGGQPQVRVYEWSASEWQELAVIPAELNYDWPYLSVAMSGDGTRVAIGDADGSASESGHTRVYELVEVAGV